MRINVPVQYLIIMTTEQECALCLVRLTVPEGFYPEKIHISAVSPKWELFMKNQRVFKTNRINLYRQTIFTPSFPSILTFNIYEIAGLGSKKLIQEIKVSKNDLQSIGKRPTMFKNIKSGFQLVWDGWMHSENSEDSDSFTDRNYSELDIPFENEDDFNFENDEGYPCLGKKETSTTGSLTPGSDKYHERSGFSQMCEKIDQSGKERSIMKNPSSPKLLNKNTAQNQSRNRSTEKKSMKV